MSLQKTLAEDLECNKSGFDLTYHKIYLIQNVNRLRKTVAISIGSFIDEADKNVLESKGVNGRFFTEVRASGDDYDLIFNPGSEVNSLIHMYTYVKKPAIPVEDQPEDYVETNFFNGATDI